MGSKVNWIKDFGIAASALEQTRVWAVEDKSIHNKERDECCPDFSCCYPELLAPKEVRMMFYNAELKADVNVVDRLLGEFLDKLITASKSKAVVAGLEAERRS